MKSAIAGLVCQASWETCEQSSRHSCTRISCHKVRQQGFGRNTGTKDVIQERASEFDDIDAQIEVDDDFKQVLGQRGSKGPAPPSKLTTHQTQIVKALIEAHADDVQAMVKDHKLNSMLLPASKLKQLLRSHSMYSQNPAARCGFRVPTKRLW
ncbi:TPA: hypothetical protein ACH3X1_005745 [Trebouxia sp. C0004]